MYRSASFTQRYILSTIVCLAICLAILSGHLSAQQVSDSILRKALDYFQKGRNLYFSETQQGYEQAIALYKQAAFLFQQANDPSDQGVAYNDIGLCLRNLGRPQEAIPYYKEALKLQIVAGDRKDEATALYNLSEALDDIGNLDEALATGRQALTVRQNIQDIQGTGQSLNRQGMFLHKKGYLDSAMAYYQESLFISRQVKNIAGEGATLVNLGALYQAIGQMQQAHDCLIQALAKLNEANNWMLLATAMNNLGYIHDMLGQVDQAVGYYRNALFLAENMGIPQIQEIALSNIGLYHRNYGDLDSAMIYLRKALNVSRQISDHRGEGKALSNIAIVHQKYKHYDQALAYEQQALQNFQELNDKPLAVAILNNMGYIEQTLGQTKSALQHYQQAMSVFRIANDRLSMCDVYGNLASFYYDHMKPPDLRKTIAYCDSANALLAGLGGALQNDPERISFSEQTFFLYENWALAWLDRARETGEHKAILSALAATEYGRARSLMRLMHTKDTKAKPGDDLAMTAVRWIKLAALFKSTILYYFMTTQQLLIWRIEPSGDVFIHRQSISRDSLSSLVAAMRHELGIDQATRQIFPLMERNIYPIYQPGKEFSALRMLGKLLIPDELLIKSDVLKQIIVIPQGILSYVPFAALPEGSRDTALATRCAISYAPSLQALLESENRRPNYSANSGKEILNRMLFVGNPAMPSVTVGAGGKIVLSPLEAAEEEVTWIAKKLGVTPLLGKQATETQVTRRIGKAPIIHLATHGYAYASENHARDSFIALAPDNANDGLLTVAEVIDSLPDLCAEIVILSACQTGLGNLKQTEGVLGLQRAFLAKGARSVMVSLWSVSDTATRLLMQRFYQHWLSDPDHPAKTEALRRAQLDVQKTSGFEHPRYWAAFQVVGCR